MNEKLREKLEQDAKAAAEQEVRAIWPAGLCSSLAPPGCLRIAGFCGRFGLTHEGQGEAPGARG